MFKNSTELFEHAIRELQNAIENNNQEVEILLDKNFSNNSKKFGKFCKKFETQRITDVIREKFPDYEIKSVIFGRCNFMAITSFEKKPCNTVASYSLIWKFTLQKK